MVAARLECGQQALLHEITVLRIARPTSGLPGDMRARPLSQGRHVMTEDEAVKCLNGANAEFGTSASRARRTQCRAREPSRGDAFPGTVVSQNIKAINDALQIMQLEIRSCSKGGKLYHALVNQARARGESAPSTIDSRERVCAAR